MILAQRKRMLGTNLATHCGVDHIELPRGSVGREPMSCRVNGKPPKQTMWQASSSAAVTCRYSAAWTLGGISTGASGDTAGPLSAVPSGAN